MSKSIFPKLIVSCQIRPGEPMYSKIVLERIIDCMVQAGITCIRTNTDHVSYAHHHGLDVICLKKPLVEPRYINPDRASILQCIKHEPYGIAIESTQLLHPNSNTLTQLYETVRKYSKSSLIIADAATVEDAMRAEKMGADVVTTTLARISTRGGCCGSHKEHVALVRTIASKVSLPVIAEGGIQSPEEALELLRAGAASVVIGYSIVNPLSIAKTFNHILSEPACM